MIGRQHAHDDQHAERDRQIEVAAFLGQIGRGEIDDDPARRQGEAHGTECRADPLAALGHRLVRQADDGEARQAAGDLHLDVDLGDVQPKQRDGAHAGDGEGGGRRGHAGMAPVECGAMEIYSC